MRFIFVIIVAFDILVLGAGFFFIFDRLRLSSKKDKHLTFHAIEKNDSQGYTLEDDNENSIFSALIDGEVDDYAMFMFTNGKTRLTEAHKVSGPGKNINAPNLTNISFLFDGEEIWSYLAKRSIHIETTIVSKELTLYKISKHSKSIAYARKKNGIPVYTMQAREKNIELLFTALFAIAKTEEFFEFIKAQNEQEETADV